MMSGVTDYYVIPFALALGATALQIGWISGLPNLLASFGQFFAVGLIYRVGGRRRLLVWSVLGQTVLLFAVAQIAWLRVVYAVELLLALWVGFAIAGAVAGPAWGSLMTEYIPRAKRGQYFAWRSRTMAIVSMVTMMAGGALLYASKSVTARTGFFVIFMFAALCRLVSAHYLSQMEEVPQRRDPASDFTFWRFLTRFRESNFVKFVAFVAALTFAAYLAGPFFVVFMLRDLQFSYLTFTLLHILATLAGFVALPLWGRHADWVGNVRVLKLAAFLTVVVPVFWLLSRNVLYLAFVQMFAGFAWSGVNLCASNFIYDAVSAQKRARCISYFSAINGFALFLGATTGGFLASQLPPIHGFPLLSLFAVSATARFVAFASLVKGFREVRPLEQVSFQALFFSVVGIRPLFRMSRD